MQAEMVLEKELRVIQSDPQEERKIPAGPSVSFLKPANTSPQKTLSHKATPTPTRSILPILLKECHSLVTMYSNMSLWGATVIQTTTIIETCLRKQK